MSAPDEDLVCAICRSVLVRPHATECCGQHFCEKCLKKTNECPHCHKANFVHMFYLPMQWRINNLNIYCSNKCEGCEVITNVGQMDSHLKECEYARIPCKNTGCKETILRKNFNNHVENECPNRIVQCQYCGKSGEHNVIMGEHQLSKCPEIPITCPRFCDLNKNFKRKDLKDHANHCPLEPIHCPYYKYGCKDKIVRKDRVNHLASSTEKHLVMVNETCKKQSDELEILSDSVNQSEIMIDHLKQTIAKLETHKKQAAESQMLRNFEIQQLRGRVEKLEETLSLLSFEVNSMLMATEKNHLEMSIWCMKTALTPELQDVKSVLYFRVPKLTNAWNSLIFYTLNEYRMQLVFTEYTNAQCCVFLSLLRDEQDSPKKWPISTECDMVVIVHSLVQIPIDTSVTSKAAKSARKKGDSKHDKIKYHKKLISERIVVTLSSCCTSIKEEFKKRQTKLFQCNFSNKLPSLVEVQLCRHDHYYNLSCKSCNTKFKSLVKSDKICSKCSQEERERRERQEREQRRREEEERMRKEEEQRRLEEDPEWQAEMDRQREEELQYLMLWQGK